MADLWNITHESNDLSEYDSTQTDFGDLSTSASAALASTGYGLDIFINDTNAIYGQVNQTDPGADFRYRFHIDPNSITMASGDEFEVNKVTITGSPWTVYQTYLTYNGADYRLRFRSVEDDGTATSSYTTITDAEHYVEVYIEQASSSVAGDGQHRFWVDGGLEATHSSLDNYDNIENMATVRFGAPGELDAGNVAEARDDRFVAALDVTGRPFRFAYVVRAVTPGRFTMPGVVVEDMYAPGVFGRTAVGQVRIAPRPG